MPGTASDNLPDGPARLAATGRSGRSVLFYVFFGLILGWAGFVRLWALGERPFWADEAWVATATSQLSYKQLLIQTDMPLPPFFAATVKFFGNWINPPEFGMRLVPALCGWACVPLVYLLARILRAPRSVALAAMSLMATSNIMVRWSRELKQYQVEGLCVLLLAIFVFRLRHCDRTRRAGYLAAIVAICILGPWLGYGFVPPAIAMGFTMMLVPPHIGSRRTAVIDATTALAALGSSTLVLHHFIAGPQAAHPALQVFTSSFFIDATKVGSWIAAAYHGLVTLCNIPIPWDWMQNLPKIEGALCGGVVVLFIGLLTAAGLVGWPGRGRADLWCWMFGSWGLTVVAAIARRYPFGQPRMAVCLAIPLILTNAAGLVYLAKQSALFISGRSRPGIVLALCLTLVPITFMIQAPLHHAYSVWHNYPALLQLLRRHRTPGELLIVSALAGPCVRFYLGDGQEPVVYVPNESGPLARLDFDYDSLRQETEAAFRHHWWIVCTADTRPGGKTDPLLQWMIRQKYELEPVTANVSSIREFVPQIYHVTRNDTH